MGSADFACNGIFANHGGRPKYEAENVFLDI
jgi:hypothetical protein